MVRMNNEVKNSEAGKFLAENYGKTVSRSAFDAAVAKSWGRENVKAVKLSCHTAIGLSHRNPVVPESRHH